MRTLTPSERTKVRFCIAGITGGLVYIATLYGLTEHTHVWYLTSSIIAFILNNCITFTLHKYWVFRDQGGGSAHQQFIYYFVLAVLFLIVNSGLLYVLVQYCCLWYLAAQAIVTLILSILSFITSKQIFEMQEN